MVELSFEQLEGRNMRRKERKEGREGESHSFQHNQLIPGTIKQLIKPVLMRNTHSANNCRWGHCILWLKWDRRRNTKAGRISSFLSPGAMTTARSPFNLDFGATIRAPFPPREPGASLGGAAYSV